jgi:hypothetical protein
MLIIADARFPESIVKNLARFGRVLPFFSSGIVYESIGGHPDIFLCPTPDALIAAPNTPSEIIEKIKKRGIVPVMGTLPVGAGYPASARYNVFIGNDCLVHRGGLTDHAILEHAEGLHFFDVRQGYARCSVIEAGGLHITSDRGIDGTLKNAGKETFYIDPSSISLPGQHHGLFGGCAGVFNNLFFLAGSVGHFPEGSALRNHLQKRNIEIVELYDGPLLDGGGILILETP